MTMTPWFELARHTRERHERMLANGREAQLAGRATTRESWRRAYFRAWWWCRPRDRTVYVLQDARRRLAVTSAAGAPGTGS